VVRNFDSLHGVYIFRCENETKDVLITYYSMYENKCTLAGNTLFLAAYMYMHLYCEHKTCAKPPYLLPFSLFFPISPLMGIVQGILRGVNNKLK
jgi:hypothetical protein